MDRRLALARGESLPERTRGTALFADISGFTPLADAFVQALGAQRAAEEITRQLNRVYDALVAEVHQYRGSVIGFVGDAITCWFDAKDEGRGMKDEGRRMKDEGRRMKDEGRRMKDEGRRMKDELTSSFILLPSSFIPLPSSFASNQHVIASPTKPMTLPRY